MIITLKKKFRYFYKKIIIQIFKQLYNKPKLLGRNQIDNSEYQFKIKLNNKIYRIFHLVEGSIYTDSNDTTAYVTKNKNLSNASMQYAKFDNINSLNKSVSQNETLSIGTPKIKKKLTVMF